MPIFKINGTKLFPINEVKIDLEKDIQSLTEQNLENVFGLEFVCSEFALNNFRIDTLAFDKETNSFVIIEYKRDRNFSVVDQGYAYLSLMLNNKAEFILEYQERKNSSINRNQIDWQQTKVVFIANAFTPHQQQAIQFKDLPIELWKVRKYDNGTLLYNQIEAATSSASISTISKSETVKEVSKEIKKYSVEEHFKPEMKKSLDLYENLKEKLTSLDQRITINPVRNYIGFYIGWKVITAVKPRANNLVVDIQRTQPSDVKDPESKLNYIETSWKSFNQHMSKMVINDINDIDYYIFIMKQRIEKLYK